MGGEVSEWSIRVELVQGVDGFVPFICAHAHTHRMHLRPFCRQMVLLQTDDAGCRVLWLGVLWLMLGGGGAAGRGLWQLLCGAERRAGMCTWPWGHGPGTV